MERTFQMFESVCKIEKIAPEVDSLNIGGGFPIKNSFNLIMIMNTWQNEIVYQIKNSVKKGRRTKHLY